MKIFRIWLKKCGIFVMISALNQLVYAQTIQNAPLPMLEQTAQLIIEHLKQQQSQLKSNHAIAHNIIQRYLLPHVDVVGMSRSVLGKEAWMKASAAEKSEFTHVFTQLVIRTYATPLAEYSGETIAFLPIRGSISGHFVRVNSIISRPNGQKIPLSYQLVEHQGVWKIYDFQIEGVSLLQSFHSQFGQMLQHGQLHELIVQMQNNQKKG